MLNIEVLFFELCPLTRQVRILLNEKKIEHKLIYNNLWKEHFTMDPIAYSSQLPKLVANGVKYNGWYNVLHYIEKNLSCEDMFGISKDEPKIKEIILFMNDKFYNQVMHPIMNEKIVTYINHVSPDARNIRSAKKKCHEFLKHIENDLKKFHWLSHNELSAADLVTAAHISVLDYLNEINWVEYKLLKDWYSIIKSRPSLRPILKEKFSAFEPPVHYTNLDF